MSTTPEPMTEERLAEIRAHYDAALPAREGVLSHMAALESCSDVPALLAEVRRLQEENTRLWDERESYLKQVGTQNDLLLERAHQAEELLAQVKELRVMLGVFLSFPSIQELAGPKLTQDAAKAYARTPAAALELQLARRAVVEAAKACSRNRWTLAETRIVLVDAIDALEKREASK
jgi:hypothetical protein